MSAAGWATIFDMDGVLVDSSLAHRQAWAWLGQRQGQPFGEELFQRTFGMHNGQILPIWLGREVEPAELEELAGAKEEKYRELAPELLRPIPGVVELVRALHAQGVALAVGSSGPRPNIELILGRLGLEDCFQALATGEDVVHGKPDPEVFLVAARRLELAPARCLVIEDAPQGIEAARRAGMRVLAISSSRPAQELAADRVVAHFEGLQPEELRRLLPA